jgi:hypothetical protein
MFQQTRQRRKQHRDSPWRTKTLEHNLALQKILAATADILFGDISRNKFVNLEIFFKKY